MAEPQAPVAPVDPHGPVRARGRDLVREVVLPGEQRERWLGAVNRSALAGVVGVTSGLALAATMLAMVAAQNPASRAHRCAGHADRVVRGLAMDGGPDGYLGVALAECNGVRVEQVVASTPAEQVGLQPGDEIVAVAGAPIRSLAHLQHVIAAAGCGSEAPLLIERRGEQLVLRPTLACTHAMP